MARIVVYLPALNRIVVEATTGKGKSRERHHQWHDTVKDMVVEKVVDGVECPITGASVSRGVAAGVTIFFRPLQLDRRVVLEDGDVEAATLDDALTMIDYDVPSHGETRGFTPCDELRKYAVPMTKSVWLVRSGSVPWNFIAQMRSMGVKIDTSELSPKETRRKVARALLFMIDQVNARIASVARTAREADERLREHDADVDESERDAALKRYRKQAAAIAHSVKEYAESTLLGARAFTMNPESFGLQQLRDAAAQIRRDTSDRAAAYARGAAALATAPTLDAQAAAPLAAADQLPVHIMGDLLRDAEKEKEADDINDVFDLV